MAAAYLAASTPAESASKPEDQVDAPTLVKMLNEMAAALQAAVSKAQEAEEAGTTTTGSFVPFTPRTMSAYTPRSRTAMAVSEMAGHAQNTIMQQYGFTDADVFGLCVQKHMKNADVIKALQLFEVTAKNAMSEVEAGPTTI